MLYDCQSPEFATNRPIPRGIDPRTIEIHARVRALRTGDVPCVACRKALAMFIHVDAYSGDRALCRLCAQIVIQRDRVDTMDERRQADRRHDDSRPLNRTIQDEYATAKRPPGDLFGKGFGRQTPATDLQTVLQGIREKLVDCFHCQTPAVLLRHRMGRAVPLCRAHAHGDSLDREITRQRKQREAMRR